MRLPARYLVVSHPHGGIAAPFLTRRKAIEVASNLSANSTNPVTHLMVLRGQQIVWKP